MCNLKVIALNFRNHRGRLLKFALRNFKRNFKWLINWKNWSAIFFIWEKNNLNADFNRIRKMNN